MHQRAKTSRLARGCLLAVLLVAGCGGDEQKPPPGPGPDTFALPSAFDIASSTSTLTSAGTSTPGAVDYAKMIREGAGLAAETEQLLSFLLSPLELLQIPVGTNVTTFQSTLTLTNGDGSKSVSLAASIDFADFDLDGDGQAEGCSGNTGALPICLRVWLDGERFLAGRLDAFPSAQSPGAGHLVMNKPASMPGGEQGMGVAVRFDHVDPANSSSEVFWGVPAEGTNEIVAVRHIVLTRVGEAAKSLRTLNLSDQMDVAAPGPHTLRFIVRYRDDQDLWSGSMDAQGVFTSMLGLVSFPAVCVASTTGASVDAAQCQSIGIDAAAITSVDLAAASAVALPAAFPAQPTF